MSHNLHRRHLTTSQRASVAAKMAKLKHGEVGNGRKVDAQLCVSTVEDAATQLNVSPRSVTNAKIIQEHGSDSVKKAVEQGVYYDWMAWQHWRLDLCTIHDS